MKASLALCLVLALTVFAGDNDNNYQPIINLLCSQKAKNNVGSVEKLLDCVDKQLHSNMLKSIAECNDAETLEGLILRECNEDNTMDDRASKCLKTKVHWNDITNEVANTTFINCAQNLPWPN